MTLLLAAALLPPASGQAASEDEQGWTNLNPDPRPTATGGDADMGMAGYAGFHA